MEHLYEHDGARSHIAKQNARSFSAHSKMKGFKITVAVQPSQSSDVNVDDLAFCRCLQTDVELVAKENRRDLLAAVQRCWEEYLEEKMESVWHCLYSSYKGIFEDGGGNDYQRSRGSRAALNRGREVSDDHDKVVRAGVVKNGRSALQQLQEAAEVASTKFFFMQEEGGCDRLAVTIRLVLVVRAQCFMR